MSETNSLSSQLRQIINKAYRALESARSNVDDGDYDFACSRAYYSAFYAIEAILLTKNLSFSKHAGVIAAFNKYFIKPDIFMKEYSKMIERLFRDRQTGDYVFDPVISEDDANENIRMAEQILASIEGYLVEKGLMKKGK